MTTTTDTHVTRAFAPALRDTGLPAGVIGQVSGIALVYDVIDSYGTTFARGALARTMRERIAAGKVKLFYDHGKSPITGVYDSDLHIGTVKSLEDVQLDGGRWGAYMVADLLDTPKAHEVKQYLESVLASGGETGLSIGGLAKGIKSSVVKIDGIKVERITEFPISEISITSMQAVPDSEVLAVRASSGACAAHLRDALALHDTLHPETGTMKPSVATHDQMTAMMKRALAALRPKKKATAVQVPVGIATVPGVGIVGTSGPTSAYTSTVELNIDGVTDTDLAEKIRAAIAAGTILATTMIEEDVWTETSSREDEDGEMVAETLEVAAIAGDAETVTETVDVDTTQLMAATIQLQVKDRPSLEAALDVLLHALPLAVIRAHVDPVLGNATTDDSNATERTSGDSNAEAEDSRTTTDVVFATMDERLRALRQSYAEAA